MSNLSGIREHMEVIGADGVHVGIVDRVEGGRIKLTKAEAPGGSHSSSPPSKATRCGCRPMRPMPSCSRKKRTARRGTEAGLCHPPPRGEGSAAGSDATWRSLGGG